jgi:hypothetical protein
MSIYRQGDVLIVQCKAVKGTEEQRQGDLILAHGEVTGHAHRIKSHAVRAWSADAERFIQVLETVALTHEEHSTVKIPPGMYQVVIQTEYTPKELRRVQD